MVGCKETQCCAGLLLQKKIELDFHPVTYAELIQSFAIIHFQWI